jgi:hypothetical protein
MHAANLKSRIRRKVSFVAMAAVLGLSAIGLTQCRMTDDTITGVDINSSETFGSHKTCTRKCDRTYKDASKAEEVRHRIALRQCGRNATCRKAENVKHKQLKEQIQKDRVRCKKGCYNEGGGKGGR